MLKSCARLFPLLSSSLFSTIQRLGVTCVFFVHSCETFDTFSQSVSLLIAVRRASSRSPYRGRGGRATRRLQSVGFLSQGCYFFSQRHCVMFQTLDWSIGYFKETFLFNELVAHIRGILIKVENVGSVEKR